MPEVKIIYSWSSMGQDGVDSYISQSVPSGEMRRINPDDVRYIITLNNQERKRYNSTVKRDVKQELLDVNLVEDDKTYYIFYSFNPSSSYKTTIAYENDSFKIKTVSTGFGLQAFWSEVIILELS